jgi:hypothetical protein
MPCSDCRDRIDSLERKNRELRRRIERMEAEMSEPSDDFDDDDIDRYRDDPSEELGPPAYSKTEKQSMSSGFPDGDHRHGAIPAGDYERAKRRYRRETTPDHMSTGLGLGQGRVFGESVARYAMTGKDRAGMAPGDLALATISRYRRHRND